MPDRARHGCRVRDAEETADSSPVRAPFEREPQAPPPQLVPGLSFSGHPRKRDFARRTVCVLSAPGNRDSTVSVVEGRAVTVETPGRDWAEIGLGLLAAFALAGIGAAGIWAVIVLGSALA